MHQSPIGIIYYVCPLFHDEDAYVPKGGEGEERAQHRSVPEAWQASKTEGQH